MKLIARIALLPDAEQHCQLLATLERVNAACDFISHAAWITQTFPKYNLQKVVYADVRGQFGLSANLTIRAIGKVADAYKLDRKRQRTFRPHGAIPYDYQIVSYRVRDSTVSIQVLGGRIRLPFTCGERARALLATQHGESDLIYRDGRFYLFAPCDVEEPDPADASEFLGVDLGITTIAMTSDGTVHGGGHLKNVRHRHRRLRAKLQRKGTKSAKRRLRARAGKERNTSRTCPACGCIDQATRHTQSLFSCVSCGLAGPADLIAAGTISRRAALNRPDAGGTNHRADPLPTSPRLQAWGR